MKDYEFAVTTKNSGKWRELEDVEGKVKFTLRYRRCGRAGHGGGSCVDGNEGFSIPTKIEVRLEIEVT